MHEYKLTIKVLNKPYTFKTKAYSPSQAIEQAKLKIWKSIVVDKVDLEGLEETEEVKQMKRIFGIK